MMAIGIVTLFQKNSLARKIVYLDRLFRKKFRQITGNCCPLDGCAGIVELYMPRQNESA